MKTVVEVQDQINEQRADNQEIIQSELNRLNRAKEEIEHLKTELSWAEQAFDNSAKIISEARKELNRLDNTRIFRDIDRETKVQSDAKQKKIIEVTS
jgi:archaellum component FlaC